MGVLQQAIVNALWITSALANIFVLVMMRRKSAPRKLVVPKMIAFTSLCLAVIASYVDATRNAAIANFFSFLLGVGIASFYLILRRHKTEPSE